MLTWSTEEKKREGKENCFRNWTVLLCWKDLELCTRDGLLIAELFKVRCLDTSISSLIQPQVVRLEWLAYFMWEDSVGVGESALWIFSVFYSVFHCSTLGCPWHPTFSCHTFSCHWGTIEILFSPFKVTHGMFWRWGSFRVNTAWRSTWQSGEFHLFDPPPSLWKIIATFLHSCHMLCIRAFVKVVRKDHLKSKSLLDSFPVSL